METLRLDKAQLYIPGCDIMTTVRSGNLKDGRMKFHTVSLLVSLFKAVCGRTNEESIKFLSGYDGSMTIDTSPMTLLAARSEIQNLLADIESDLIPVFMIDEVPPLEDNQLFIDCILL
mmetsp:Transcript_17569/g.24134  ORF Transcript_17569/g.24134 Transcript_17569/m.24134 type:complete len:118 (+) Transcript_17569:217-570(+)